MGQMMCALFERGCTDFFRRKHKNFSDIDALAVSMSEKFFALHTEGMFLSFQESAYSFSKFDIDLCCRFGDLGVHIKRAETDERSGRRSAVSKGGAIAAFNGLTGD